MSRVDLNVYNEATGFMITSEGLYGGDYSEVDSDDEAWRAAVEAGHFLPIELAQDDAITIRVVVDEPLSEQEDAEWVDRFSARLRIPDGRLVVVGGGPEYLWGEDMDEFTEVLDVPPGDYLAEIYTYLHGVNGDYCLDAVADGEPLGAYFRRTRPGMPFPLWLRNGCADDPALDPGHEDEWPDEVADYDTPQPDYVGFLLRLSPQADRPERPKMDEGWIAIAQSPRKLASCPLGLVADLPDDEG